ncbi:MAG TPA: rhodanese-like domain-containing protein [Thermodesulfobacteriota bacterium]|nr:rhodanese-like domain-containing protein [Thermodesulfobacteriota bacterium]
MKAPRITKEELKAKLERGEDITLIDVRNDKDYAESDVRLPGAVRVPLGELEARAGEFDPEREVVAYCT